MIHSRTALACAALGLTGMMAVTAQVPAGVPVATPVEGTTTMCSAATVEYSGRWSIPENGIVQPTLEACAAECELDDQCSGATWIGWESERDTPNCWFKAWDPVAAAVPCQPSNLPPGRTYAAIITLPTGATDCATIPYLPDDSIDCVLEKEAFGEFSGSRPALGLPSEAPEDVDEMPEAAVPMATEPIAAGPVAIEPIAAGPVVPPGVVAPTGAVEAVLDGLASLVPSYKAFTGADYSGNQVPPPAVMIDNVKPGIPADTAQECAEECNKDPLCNAASYYGNNPMDTWPAGQPCWLKTIGVPCELPVDYDSAVLPGTVFMLAQEDCLAVAPMDVLMPGMAPMDMMPLEAGPEMGPMEAFEPMVDTPAVAPETTREFDIGLAPTVAGIAPTVSAADPIAVDPIQGPLLTTDTPAPEPAPVPTVDSGTGIGIDDGDDDTLAETAAPAATTVDSETDAALGLATALSTVAAVAAAMFALS